MTTDMDTGRDESPGEIRSTFRSTLAQVLATLAFNCLMFNVGVIVCMPVIIIGALREEHSDLHFTQEQASWFAGMIFFVQPLGSVFSGLMQDLLGRKTCMMVVNIPQFAAWIMMFYATYVYTLFLAIIIFGLTIGFMEAAVLCYIGEISEPRLRGILSTFGAIFLNIGLFVEMALGAVTDWRTMALVSSAGPLIAFIALSLVPDSPAWLVTKGRIEDAQKAYQWLRGWVTPTAVQEELNALVTYANQSRNLRVVTAAEYSALPTKEGETDNYIGKGTSESTIKIFLHQSVQRPLRLIVIYFVVGACSSLTALRPFLIEILSSMKLPVRPHYFLLFGNILTLLGALTSSFTMPRVGKRGLTFISLGLSVVCCAGLGLYLALDLSRPWIPMMLFSVSFFIVPLGFLVIPWVLISELFPLKARGVAGGITAALGYLIMFIVIKTYYPIVSVINLSGACFLYGLIGILGFIYLYFQLPETEGVPLEVIERIFSKGEKNKDATKQKSLLELQQMKEGKFENCNFQSA